MNYDDLIEKRSQLIAEGVDNLETEQIEARTAEIENLDKQIEAIEAANKAEAEMRKHIGEENAPTAEEINKTENKEQENRTMTIDSVEYRNAFYNYLIGKETRDTLLNVDGNTAGTISASAVALPAALDRMIWDNIHSTHPILADVSTVNSGIVMYVTRHTAIATRTTGKKDADTLQAEDNTFVKVTLAGIDFAKYVEITYAEAQMSQGALESYIATEIAAELGEALAKNVFARIKTDLSSTAAATKSSSNTYFECLKTALGAAYLATAPVIYCSPAKYYAIMGEVDSNGQPIMRDGVALGATIKKDAAAGNDIFVVEPKQFVLNVIQGVTIESAKDLKAHTFVVSGYTRAEGCMRKIAAAAYVA